MNHVVIAITLVTLFLAGLVLAAWSMRRALAVVAEEPEPGTHTAECWRHLEDPGATCICRPWSMGAER